MSDLGFDGQVAIITGAGGGLGRSHALELAKRGALIVVNDLGGSVDGEGGSHTAAQQVVDEIKALGGDAVANFDSVSTPEGAAAIIKTALDAFEKVHIVVNNAGILRDRSFGNMTADEINAVVDVHLKGGLFVAQAAWQHMKDNGYGRIINTASAAGLFGNFGQANYGSAKAGLVGLTRVLAVEGAKYGIKANAIAPVAYTRMTAPLFEGFGMHEEDMKPAFITPVVILLAHQDVPVTGEVYTCGGGHVGRVFTAVTQGWTDIEKLTAEGIRDHFDEIRDEDGYSVPADLTAELTLTLAALEGAQVPDHATVL